MPPRMASKLQQAQDVRGHRAATTSAIGAWSLGMALLWLVWGRRPAMEAPGSPMFPVGLPPVLRVRVRGVGLGCEFRVQGRTLLCASSVGRLPVGLHRSRLV